MKVQKLDIVRFASKGRESFYDAIISKVHTYFEMRNISPYANKEMWLKTAVMMSLYFIPYILLVTGFASNNAWILFGLWFLMGWGTSGLGTSVMHDANH